jgi:hypothetical protein
MSFTLMITYRLVSYYLLLTYDPVYELWFKQEIL